MKAFEDLRAQASNLSEMSLDEINAEISALLSKNDDAATVKVLRAILDGRIVRCAGKCTSKIQMIIRLAPELKTVSTFIICLRNEIEEN